MHAEREIASGIELFHSYGELGNSQLLHTYGFVLPSNPHDNVAVPLSVMADNYRRLRARRDKLGLHRYDDYEEVIEIVDDSEDEEIASESHGSLDSEDSSARRSQGEVVPIDGLCRFCSDVRAEVNHRIACLCSLLAG